jgi:hypothetical protein
VILKTTLVILLFEFSTENTWEPKENLNCPDLVVKFESNIDTKKRRISEANRNYSRKLRPKLSLAKDNTNEPNGFDRGLKAEKIIGFTTQGGQSMFLVKWKNSNDLDLVLAKEAHKKCPQLVIDFYEKHLSIVENDEQKETVSRDETD